MSRTTVKRTLVRKATLAAILALVGVTAEGSFTSVAAAPVANQRFSGFIVASSATGSREVVAGGISGRGVFNGRGHVVEVQNLPDEPDNVSRDDLVFRTGTIHIVSTTQDATFSQDPATCIVTGTLTQTTTTDGGTGRFAHVTGSFAATVSVRALAQRNRDGSCSQDQGPLLELDVLTAEGTLAL